MEHGERKAASGLGSGGEGRVCGWAPTEGEQLSQQREEFLPLFPFISTVINNTFPRSRL